MPKTTIEAAESLGYTRAQGLPPRRLAAGLPRVCLPALNNNLVNLLKTTTLAYAIAVPETLYAVKQIWSESQNVPEMMIVLLADLRRRSSACSSGSCTAGSARLRIPGYGR